jgi:hypothetical protein
MQKYDSMFNAADHDGRGTGGESMRGNCDNKQAMLQMSENPRD